MAKRKKKAIKAPHVVAARPRVDWVRRVEILEEVLLALLLISALWVFSLSLHSHFTLPKLALSSVCVLLLQLTWLLRVKLGATSALMPRRMWLPLLALVAWWLLATTQSLHMQTALEGQYGRYNALYTNLLYVFLFVALCSMRMNLARLARILNILLATLLPICLYAYVQFLGLDGVFKKPFGSRPPSSVGNPVALATILMMYFPFAILMTLRAGRAQLKINYAVIAAILISVLVITGSRGPWIGALAALMITAAMLLLHSDIAGRVFNRYTVAAAVVVAPLLGFLLSLDAIQERFTLGGSFNVRIMYYIVSLDVIKDSPLFGFGFESFRLIYPDYRPEYDWQLVQDTTPTMIHNDYLQFATDNGLPAMVFYLIFISVLVYALWKAFRDGRGDHFLLVAFLSSIGGYLAQANMGWFEAGSSIMYWLLLGLAASYVNQLDAPAVGVSGQKLKTVAMACVAALGAAFMLYYAVVMFGKMSTDYDYRRAQQLIAGNPSMAGRYLRDIDEAAQDNFFYQNRIGLLYMRHLVRAPNFKDYHRAREHLRRSAELNPHDAYSRVNIVENDFIALQRRLIDRPSPESLAAIDEALQIDPNNPTVHRTATRLYAVLGDEEKRQASEQRQRELEDLDWQGWGFGLPGPEE